MSAVEPYAVVGAVMICDEMFIRFAADYKKEF
ncbi:hypothetical protein Ccur_02450 [Cryptobacterium curtum DSM 15641]|uniref:Uncharacterized protein n=1 Tax=Cryptobacterium curtum (strain ATCC 700683 / DSM 15641 / CCUG 43107 / 12-3) TaxID=469378 RepID=C7MM34_CRYCD|nr:hypothetical protein Ccur_02450 [Cryptobacterium curtum DSM 15641]